MNTYVVLAALVAVLVKGTSAGCIGAPFLVRSPIISPCVTAPLLPAPMLSTTTIVQSESVTDKLCNVLQMLPVTNLLNNQLACTNLIAPVLPCGCAYGCACGCGPIII
ncbi:uncharacterized protein LOC133532090 [Cydia pomonella]|uniref:uncharacterized protein LOC133532090 n=1 Tax=Cydia pomonella TaxID=82600 RepID=UPI002ADD6F62|nr:uncharacterized protein LOC133532090 [Cydia pomonella]